MEKIVGFFLDHRMFVNLILSVVALMGLSSLLESKKEGFPEISMNQVIVRTIYPGASPRDVELNVTVPLEEALEEVEGIKEILSTSEESVSRIIVKADDNADEAAFRKLYSDVENAIAGVSDLPEDIDGRPALNDFTSSDIPVLEVGLSGPYELLKPWADKLEKRLRRIKGVSGVDIAGLPDAEVQILVDAKKARAYQVDLRLIADAIRKRNLEGSGGTLESFTSEKKVVFLSKFESYKDVLNTNIVMNPDGYGVKLRDLATVKIVPKDLQLIVRNNGKEGAVMSIRKSGDADLLDTVDRIRRFLKKIERPRGVGTKILLDQSDLTRGRIGLLVSNSLMGFALVLAILFYVFDIKTALWTAFGIPFTLFGLFWILKLNNISLNLISLGGFVIIIGMLVDDAIVIAEAINSNKEAGLSAREAATKAVRDFWMPVLASSTTTMVAFTPLFALGGFPGKFIWTIPFMVIAGLSVSLFESYFILPAHLYHGKEKKIKKKAFVEYLEKLYERVLGFVLRRRYLGLLVFIVFLVLALISMKNFVRKDSFPQDGADGFFISLTLPTGSNANTTLRQVQKIEGLLDELPEKELWAYSSRIGTQSELGSTDRGTQNNLAIIFVYLTPFQEERTRTALEMMADLQKRIPALLINPATSFRLELKRLGPPLGKAFEMRLISNDDAERARMEAKVRKWLSGIDGVSGIDSDNLEGKEELNLKINYDVLAQAGLSVEDILTTLRIAFDGLIVTELTRVDGTLDFRLRLSEKARSHIDFIHDLPLVNRLGNLIRLERFVTITKHKSPAQVHHVNGERSTTVFSNVDVQKLSPTELMRMSQKQFPSTQSLRIEYSGQPVEDANIFKGLGLAAVIALIGIFLLIALILDSYKKPALIMLPLPFLAIGLAFTLLVHDIPMSMMPGVALVGLLGVVINDSILLVHTIYGLAENGGLDASTIIKGAASRLRAVLLTTVTTVLGVLPTGYGWGGYDPFLSHMSLTMAYGLMFSTFIILFLIPIFFMIGQDLKKHGLAFRTGRAGRQGTRR